MRTIIVSCVALLILVLNAANALHVPSARQFEISSLTTTSTRTFELFPRQDGGGGSQLVFDNGQFVDQQYASLFACTPKASPTKSPEPPPPPPPPPPASTPAPAQPTVVDGITQHDNPRCGTPSQGIAGGIQLEQGATIASFDKEVMRKFFIKVCQDSKNSVIEEHEDHKGVRYVVYSHPVGGGTGPHKESDQECIKYFGNVMDPCKFFQNPP